MTTRKFISTILLSALLVSCNRYWTAIEVDGRFIWKKEKLEFKTSNKEAEKCQYQKNSVLKAFNTVEFNVYEFDSIRIYVSHRDTILNELIMKGYIQGQYFFTNHESNKCNFINWTNPIKFTENGWTGYHIYLSNLREIKFERIPRKIQNKRPLSKAFRFSFRYSGQPFINPSVFKVEIENPNYKLGQQNINIDKFLDGGKTVMFYQSEVEI